MLDNITALKIEEGLKNNKTVKAAPGKYSKPAKLSSGKTFKEKTEAIMQKVATPATAAPEAAPATPAPEVAPAPAVEATVASPEVTQTPEAPAPVASTPEVAPVIELPTNEKVLERVKIVGITNTSLPNVGSKTVTTPRKLKVSNTVVTRTGNVLRVLESVPVEKAVEPVETQATEVAPAPAAETPAPVVNEEVQVDPTVTVAKEPVEEVPTEEVEQPNFFLGQKLNTEAIEQEEPKEETEKVEDTEVTQEEKEDKLNQYLDRNQASQEISNDESLSLDDVLKDLDEYKVASEQIFSGQAEINKLNKDLAEAKRILAEKKKEAQQMIVSAKEVLENQRSEITSKTQELSDVREAIIRWTELKEKNQNRASQEEFEEEISYGRSAA